MDGHTFDALTTTFAAPLARRGFARLLAGGALGALGVVATREVVDAKSPATTTAPAATLQPKRAHPAAAAGRAAAQSAKATPASRKKRCRYSQTICAKNGQCCPTTSGYVCAWNGNNEGATVCCGVNGARCLGDYDCCGQALCLFGVCVG